MNRFFYVFATLIIFSTACSTDESNSLLSTSDYAFSSEISGNTISNSFDDLQPGDTYAELVENEFIETEKEATSTFSIDADGASYANTRRFLLDDGVLPPLGAVRTEEMINYFNLAYPYINHSHPIALNGEVSSCPWNEGNKLVRIGIKGAPLPNNEMPATNFVFLIDVSGSMGGDDRLSLLVDGFKQFADQLTDNDKVAIVTYAGSSGVHLESTNGNKKSKIKRALDKLKSGGSTAGAEGIITAYEIAQENFIEGGNNRIILGTDGDFNIGISNREELVELIEEKRDLGIYLTAIGVGRGNYNDAALEQIANNGNGTFEYVDNVEQVKKVFIYEKSKFFTVAKDVKVQVEFNPLTVAAYRLIGYENRILNTEDFEDDTKDAGEIGANQNITALYEIVPQTDTDKNKTESTFNINFRYKLPNSNSSIPIDLEIYDEGKAFENATDFMQFTGSIAAFSLLLIDSEYKGDVSYEKVLEWLNTVNLKDEHGLKQELVSLVKKAERL